MQCVTTLWIGLPRAGKCISIVCNTGAKIRSVKCGAAVAELVVELVADCRQDPDMIVEGKNLRYICTQK